MVNQHTPVLLNEAIKILDPKPGEFYIDGTFGSGGHAMAILEKMMPQGKFLAIDWDKHSIEKGRNEIENKLPIPTIRFPIFWINDNYANLREILEREKLGKADMILLDLGFSSEQLNSSAGEGRGFSFQKDEPLIMNYDLKSKPVKEILKELSESELAQIIREFGEERLAHKIASAIKAQEAIKPIETSGELAGIICEAVPKNYERGRIHPATRTFMALRIYANHELDNLQKILKNLESILKPDGRVAIISFHSLEDRIVKNQFRDLKKAGKLEILTKKPITATSEEIASNPRARSAKLRAAMIT